LAAIQRPVPSTCRRSTVAWAAPIDPSSAMAPMAPSTASTPTGNPENAPWNALGIKPTAQPSAPAAAVTRTQAPGSSAGSTSRSTCDCA
jgi:hypothetical protein